jgi:N-acetylglucosamine-6-phosphate deacetylase
MIVLSGARIVTSAKVIDSGTIVIEGPRIVDVQPGRRRADDELHGHLIVPGFVDVHVHGVEGIDVLATPDGVARVAAALPRHGVTAFCPTSIACAPEELDRFLSSVRAARGDLPPHSARVLGAHLESNFINPDYCGAQPRHCLRLPPNEAAQSPAETEEDRVFTSAEILRVVESRREAVGIVTLAPELPGALDLIRRLVAAGHRVSLGHSAATYDEGVAGIDAGARHATHLFNRMPPFSHRSPGLVGAVFDREEVDAELIVDGHHLHPAVGRAALRALGADRALAITDGTAASGLPAGAIVQLGSEPITAGPHVARLRDGTWAGSLLTMAGAFRNLVRLYGCDAAEAARLCSTNPSRAAKAPSGSISAGMPADLVVLGPDLQVVQTFIAGVPALGERRAAS